MSVKLDNNFIEELKKIKYSERKFDFFDIISPKETLISSWLAFLFNPNLNGIGDLTIKKLLESLNLNDEYDIDTMNFENTYTEKPDRIDILIEYDKLLIVIENKIDSYEHNNQTERYFKFIEEEKKDNKEVIYIYLKPNYNKSLPTKIYDKNNNGFRVLTYKELLNSLKTINESDYEEKDKYKYLKEFLISGERFMKNEEIEYTDSIKFYIENETILNQLNSEYTELNKKINTKLRFDILSYLKNLNNKYETDMDENSTARASNYIQYYLPNWKNENRKGIHFEILINDGKVLSKNIVVTVVLHIESDIQGELLSKLEKNGFAKNTYYNGKKIEYVLTNLDFTSNEKYEESKNKILEKLKLLVNKYEDTINRIINN